MKLTIDPKHNIAYLRLRDPGPEVVTVCLSDEVNVDLAPDGKLYGIELLNANAQLVNGETTLFEVLNQVSGESREMPLPL